MDPDDSVSIWMERVKCGDEQAAADIWKRYFPQLVELARDRLRHLHRATGDEEDAALSALDSFFRATQRGRFPDLKGRESLWRLLTEMTHRKAVDIIRKQLRQKRGGGQVMGESAFGAGDSGESPGFDGLAEDNLRPELAVMMNEQCERLMGLLSDDQMRSIALAKLDGYTNEEIAERLDCSLSTVERRLRLIRRIWETAE